MVEHRIFSIPNSLRARIDRCLRFGYERLNSSLKADTYLRHSSSFWLFVVYDGGKEVKPPLTAPEQPPLLMQPIFVNMGFSAEKHVVSDEAIPSNQENNFLAISGYKWVDASI